MIILGELKEFIRQEKMETLISERGELFDKSRKLEDDIRKNLGGIRFEI